MTYQNVFNRYETKYILTRTEKEKVLEAMQPYMKLDGYGRTTIRNLYFDTDSYQLIRHSIEKPIYKEKLRIRSYGKATPQSTVFVELKKKYHSVVFKRRIALPNSEAMKWVCGRQASPVQTQISNEIDYFLDFYKTLEPKVFLSYEREAYYTKEQSDFRVTFDENIFCRQHKLTLESEAWGTPIISQGLTLMEIKCSGAIPLWITKILTEQHIYKTSFSKYGTAYQNFIFPKHKEERIYA